MKHAYGHASLIDAGKFRRLLRLSDESHRFSMLAIDQRGSLRKMIAGRSGASADEVPDDALVMVKEVITRAIAPSATAVLTDPLHGYPSSPRAIPPWVGLLLALEVTGYEASREDERLTSLIPGWNPWRIGIVGADAVKVLLWHRHDASQETQRHQDEIVAQVGAACSEQGLPFVLEVVSYPQAGWSSSSAAYASVKPDIVIDAARRYSDARFGVDLLKLEFPANLKYVEEYQDRAFAAGESVYGLAEIEGFCRRLDGASQVPWVILSAGVDPEEFIENVRLANAAGASGFLCGRAVWKHVIDQYPDESAMRVYAEGTARTHFSRIREANQGARPWTQHPRFRNAAAAGRNEAGQ